MAINVDEDTEFNDALRKHGIIPQRPKTPDTPPPPPSPTLSEMLEDFETSELQEIADDAHDDEVEKHVEAYRQKRVDDERREGKRARFGRVYPIARDDYTREVTDASKLDEPPVEGEDPEDCKQKGKGTAVICLLYKDGIARSDRTMTQMQTLAQRYPRTKFVSIVGDKCIPDLPDSRIPMIIIYMGGEILNQVVAWGADRERRIEELEALLMVAGALHVPEHRHEDHRRRRSSSVSSGSDVDHGGPTRRTGTVNEKTTKNIRSSGGGKRGQDSDGSDFEFDI